MFETDYERNVAAQLENQGGAFLEAFRLDVYGNQRDDLDAAKRALYKAARMMEVLSRALLTARDETFTDATFELVTEAYEQTADIARNVRYATDVIHECATSSSDGMR